MKSIVIFGGAGFVGKHLIRRLSKYNYKIIIPYQVPTSEAKLRLLGNIGQITPVYYDSLNDKRVISILKSTDICLNLKTSWSSKKISFNQTIFEFNKKLLDILIKNSSLKKYIFFSGLGVDIDKKSLRSKAIFESEKLISSYLNNAIIIRPGIIIGREDNFLSRLLPIFKISFLVPIFGDGKARVQPVFIDDVALIVERLINQNIIGKHIFEVTGNNIFTYNELYKLISQFIGKKKIIIKIPMFLARFLVRIIEIFPFSPINLEQLALFEKDNIANKVDKDCKYLDIIPQDAIGIIRKIAKN